MQRLLINARFMDRPMTGVDRVASELMSALHAHTDFASSFTLERLRPSKPRSLRKLNTLLWEQLNLATKAPSDILISPCNTGPILRHNHIVFMHDAQVYTQPESYSESFRARYKLLMPLLGKTARRIIVPSEHTKADLQRFGISRADKIGVVPNGADHILRTPPDTSVLKQHALQPGHYFLALGSLAKHKNLEMLIRASEARRNRDMPLVIAGGTNTNVFATPGIAPSKLVKTIGRITDQELRALYENATALVFPSLSEGFGLPPAEGMFCGCPVISTTGGAVPEVCGGASIAVDPKDRAGWTQAMDQLAGNHDLRAQLRQNGLQHVKQFTWRAAADQMLRELSEITSTDRRKATRWRKGKIP